LSRIADPFLLAWGLGVSAAVPRSFDGVQPLQSKGYLLDSSEGEHFIHFRDQGNIFIKFGSATGSDNLAMGTQQVMAGTGIPVHRHFHMDEAFYVLEGSGTVLLNDLRHQFEKGGIIHPEELVARI